MIIKCAVCGIWGCQEHTKENYWHPACEEPPENGRYLVFYRQGNVKRIFVADYDSYFGGWQNVWNNMEILCWGELPKEPEA